MAIAFVQGLSKSGTSSPAASAAFATAVALKDLIVIFAGNDVGAAGLTTGFTDSLGNTYTKVPNFEKFNATNNLTLSAWYSVVANPGSGNIVTGSFNATSANINFAVQHFNGFIGTPTLDQSVSSDNASSTTASTGTSAATTVATELVVAGAVHAGVVAAYTLGAGYTNLTDGSVANREIGMESKIVSSTGTQSGTFTIATAATSIGGLLTFYDLGSAGGAGGSGGRIAGYLHNIMVGDGMSRTEVTN